LIFNITIVRFKLNYLTHKFTEAFIGLATVNTKTYRVGV